MENLRVLRALRGFSCSIQRLLNRRGLLAVCLLGLALALAWSFVGQFFAEPRGLWNGMLHDRNGHAVTAIRMALAVENLDVAGFVSEVLRCRVWPPLHGLIAAGAWMMGGHDWRMLVMPGVLGWVLMVSGAGWLAGRCAGDGKLAWVAALIASGLAALSPAHRVFATDVMLESLGAGLSVMAIVLFGLVQEKRGDGKWEKLFAVTLTLLFFEKYNYWMIVVLALAAAWSFQQGRVIAPWLRGVDWIGLLRREARHPLNWLGGVCLVLVVVITMRGPTVIDVFGKHVSLYPPNNLLTAAYAFFFFRFVAWKAASRWRPQGGIAAALLWFHVLPVALSFLIPQRLGAFLGFLSPTNFGDAAVRPFPENVMFYAEHFVRDYHANAWFAGAALVFAALGCWRLRGSVVFRAVVFCFVLGAVLAFLHPNQKSRFMHTWLPMLWVASGAGAAVLLQMLSARAGLLAGVCLLGVMLVAGGTDWYARGRSPESGNRGEGVSLLDLSDDWLAQLPGKPRVTFWSSQQCEGWLEWTFKQRFLNAGEMVWLRKYQSKTGAASMAEIESALTKTGCDWLVTVQVPTHAAAYIKVGDRPEVRESMERWVENPAAWRVEWREVQQGILATLWRREPGLE